ncbi:extracellular solute-binding protein [Acuticoccus sp. I52.16.1]|uniref:extracellular solute-binding protein n=1 Tax=Acuticoccus sp. I52.16.1 TaxID=2928472 RepID=UPI001FD169D4|nr:extracellular solute-binding protein [Acuticoccus sp. I52.16.1]UOM34468.1 extracellular solute-binding protein [Acuticoccus sp. I52.16.1]
MCLSVGEAVEACADSAARFSEATGHNVRVVSADSTGRYALERYRALFDVQSGRIDVLQFPDSWIPALGADLSTMPEPEEGAVIPAVLDAGRDAGRLVGLPQHLAITLLFLRGDVVADDPHAWSDLRQSLLAAPADGANGLAVGAAGPTLFPLFLDWVYSFGAESLDDHEPLVEALTLMNGAIGTIAPASVVSASPQEAIADFTGGTSAALIARSTALKSVNSSPIAQSVVTRLRPQAADAPPQAPMMVTTWFTGVSRHSRNQEAATQLAQFVASEPEQRRAAEEHGLAPTWQAVYTDPKVQEISPVVRRIAENIDVMVPPPIKRYGVNYLDLADDVATAVRKMLNGEADPETTARVIEASVRRASRQVD